MRRKCGFVLLLAGTLGLYGANNVPPGTPVSVLVTVESKGENSSTLSKDDVLVKEDRDSRPVTEFRRLDGTSSQILLLIDDSAGGGFDTQISDIKKFILALPANAEVGVGYMRNGMSQIASDFTLDHSKAANSVRLAMGSGGGDVSPYDSLTDAIKKWPMKDSVVRREVVMISSGIEGLGGGFPPDNPYVNAGIASAVKAGILVYAIYNPGYGHLGHSLWRATEGQNFLSQLTDETGGELYLIGFGSAVSFEPYFTDILKRQSEQYVLTFEARPEKKSGMEAVKIRAASRGVSLAAPDKIYVKAGL